VERTPIEAKSSKSLGNKPEAVGRKGNIALDVHRPLFAKGPNWEFQEFKNNLLEQEDADKITQLPELKFFDGEDEGNDLDTVVMSSYPSSGNTLLRAWLEKIMGLVTGSDCDITKKLNLQLMDMGLAGEGLVDKRVWIVKTHYPERYGKTKFGSERCILLVRSPLDCVTSLFNMVCSGSHDRSITDEDFVTFKNHWAQFIEQEITVWKDFHDFWLKAKIPVHIIRYEDIVLRPEPTFTDLMKFILNVDTIENTRVAKYIKLAILEKAPEIYKPRKGKVNSNRAKFNPSQLEFMCDYAQELLTRLDYAPLFLSEEETAPNLSWIDEFNAKSLKLSQY